MRYGVRRLGLLLAAGSCPLLAVASTGGEGDSAVVGTSDIVRMVVTLGLVLGAILLVAWVLRRAGGIGGASRGIQVLASVSVGQRERVVLVDVGGQQLLVGVAPGSVRLLESFDEAVVTTETGSQAGGDFASRLRSALAGQEKSR